MENNVTVLIPIGPQPEYLQWLPEAIESVLQQTVPVDEILLLADGFNLWEKIRLDTLVFPDLYGPELGLNKSIHWNTTTHGKVTYIESEDKLTPKVSWWSSPWNIGFAQVFNCGVGLADNDLIIYLASDDKLMPTAVEDCLKTWNDNNQKDAWYAMSYWYHEDTHTIPNNAAMITENLWKYLKGYPPSAFAGPDAMLLSCLIAHANDRIIKVAEGKANYWVREHPYQDTKRQFSFFAASGVMEIIRDMETRRFVPNAEVILK